MKTCSKCKINKKEIEFNIDNRSPSGLQSACKVCLHDYYLRNRLKKNQYRKQYYESNKEKISGYMKQYTVSKADKISSKKREYYINNKKRLIEYQMDLYRFYKGNTGYRRKLIKLGREAVCEKCGKESNWEDNKMHVHHIDKNNKNNQVNNLQILCAKCHENLHANWNFSVAKRRFKFNLLFNYI